MSLGEVSIGDGASGSQLSQPCCGAAAGAALVVHPGDLDRQFEQQHQRERQRQHRERVLAGRGDRGEDEQAEDQPAAPGPELGVAEHPDEVERHHQQRDLEADPEDDQQGDEEAEVVVAGQRRGLDLAADGEQEGQALGDDEVGQHGAGDEQHGRGRDEAQRVAAFLRVEPGGDELPELVEPHRAGQHHPGGGRDLEPEVELVERAGAQQGARAVRGERGPRGGRDGAVGRLEDLAEARRAEQADAEPDVAEDRGDPDHDQRDAEPVPQLEQVLDQRHRAVGVHPTAAARTQPAQGPYRGLHRARVSGQCRVGQGRAGRARPAAERCRPRPGSCRSPSW